MRIFLWCKGGVSGPGLPGPGFPSAGSRSLSCSLRLAGLTSGTTQRAGDKGRASWRLQPCLDTPRRGRGAPSHPAAAGDTAPKGPPPGPTAAAWAEQGQAPGSHARVGARGGHPHTQLGLSLCMWVSGGGRGNPFTPAAFLVLTSLSRGQAPGTSHSHRTRPHPRVTTPGQQTLCFLGTSHPHLAGSGGAQV